MLGMVVVSIFKVAIIFLRRKDIKSITKIFGCAKCAHTIFGREVFLLKGILKEIHSSKCEFAQHATTSLRICA